MDRQKPHKNHAARQRAYAARMKPDAAENSKAAKRDKEHNKRDAIKKADVMNSLRQWLDETEETRSFGGVSGEAQ